MKTATFLLIICSLPACVGSYARVVDSSIPVKRDANDPTVTINNFVLTLKQVAGRCSLTYHYSNEKDGTAGRTLPLDIGAPCEFLRSPATLKPQFYTYQKGANRRSVLIVTGGPAASSARDRLLPRGCGTEIQKLRVFDDRIELGDTDKDSYLVVCPLTGLDEVYFAA